MAQTESSGSAPESTANQQTFLRRGEDYESLYANNVQFQPSEWDLKIIFGELDREPGGSAFVEQHTAISVPWLQAKVAHYFLTLQLGVYEMAHGKIPIPVGVLPPKPEPPTGDLKGNEDAKQVYEYVKRMHEQLITSL